MSVSCPRHQPRKSKTCRTLHCVVRYTVSGGLEVFKPSYSRWSFPRTVWPWLWQLYEPSKRQSEFTHRHSLTYEKICIFSSIDHGSTILRISKPARHQWDLHFKSIANCFIWLVFYGWEVDMLRELKCYSHQTEIWWRDTLTV